MPQVFQTSKQLICFNIIFFGLVLIGKSQPSFEEGFYVTYENDTIYGLIDDRSGAGNHNYCTYKLDNQSDQKRFSPSDIKGYQFSDGQYFISKEIQVHGEKKDVFVEYLVDGIADLFFYRDATNYFYIVEKEDGETIEVEKEEVAQKQKSGMEYDPHMQIRRLKVAFSDCMEIQPMIDETELSHRSLINLTRDYHNYVCDDYECIVYEKKLGPSKIYFAPIIGFSNSAVGFDRGFYSRFNYDRNNKLGIGAQVNMVLTSINDRLSIQFDLLFNKNDYHGNYLEYYNLYLNNNRLQYSLLLKYQFPTTRVRPSVGFGVIGESLTRFSPIAIVNNIPGSPPQQSEVDNLSIRTALFGPVAQFGLNYRLFNNREAFTNLRYSLTKGEANDVGVGFVNIKSNTFALVSGFYLNKVE